MSNSPNELIQQITSLLAGSFDSATSATLLHEAREEALAEVRALLKGAMVDALLARVLGDMREGVAPSNLPAASTPPDTTSDQAALQREIAQIRQQIAANKELLGSPATELSLPPAPVVEDDPVCDFVTVTHEGNTLGEARCAYYVYGIVKADADLTDLPQNGIAPEYPVYALPCRELQAIVSQVPLDEFGEEPIEANLRDMAWLEDKVRRHQSLLDALMTTCAVVPLRFGAIYRSEARVHALLNERYAELYATLDRLAGKQEWGVKLFCDLPTLHQEIAALSPKVQTLTAELVQKAEGAAYFLRKRLEQLAAQESERLADERAHQSHAQLARHAAEAVTNPTQSNEINGRSATMILNGAYLVTAERLPAFRDELAQLEAAYSDLGFSYELTGPWPPYNFADGRVASPQSAEFAEA